MKWVKKALAVTLAVMLVLPSIGALAEGPNDTSPSETMGTENIGDVTTVGTDDKTSTAGTDGTSANGEEAGNPEQPAAVNPETDGKTTTPEAAGTSAVQPSGDVTTSGTDDKTPPAGTDGTPTNGEEAGSPEQPAVVRPETDGTPTPPEAADPAATQPGGDSEVKKEGEAEAANNAAAEAAGEETTATEVKTETNLDTAPVEMLQSNAAIVPQAEAVSVSTDKVPQANMVQFNTGNHVWSIVSKEVFWDQGLGDGFFAADGSYTINIPEKNPFFPYEVQFTYQGKTWSEWFMSPDDTVEVGGHRFAVSAYFDDTAITQISLKVAEKTVVVYPDAKTFTNDGDGTAPTSLQPLKSKNFGSVDLTGLTPVELTMVEVQTALGGNAPTADQSLVWKRKSDNRDHYRISGPNDKIDLSYGSWHNNYSGTDSTRWEMIVGTPDQLDTANIRGTLEVKVTAALDDWLTPVIYAQDAQGQRTATQVRSKYSNEYLEVSTSGKEEIEKRISTTAFWSTAYKDMYISLEQKLDRTKFSKSAIKTIKVVEGTYTTAAEAGAAVDVTAQLMTSAGYKASLYGDTKFTMISYNDSGSIIGVMPFTWHTNTQNDKLTLALYKDSSTRLDYDNWIYETDTSVPLSFDGRDPANGQYTLVMGYDKGDNLPDISAVYVGKYSTIAEAAAAGATNIKGQIYGSISDGKGYVRDYSQGVDFTVFVGPDGANQKVYSFNVKARNYEPSQPSQPTQPSLKSGAQMWFDAPYLMAKDGHPVKVYKIDETDDSYAEGNYITFLVEGTETLNNTQYAVVFRCSDQSKVYTSGSSTPEISGQTFHSFVNGPIQFTVSSENGENASNYWIQVKNMPDPSYGQLYINSLTDTDAKTRVENGVIYSTREMMLDLYHNYVHDICFANIGTTEVPKLSAELNSTTVELDPYWTFKGEKGLSGLSTVEKADLSTPDKEGELPNLAKIRLRVKEGVANGTDISGTLTIKSAGQTLMVLTLTGTVGDPTIKTDIPEAVKYVPYGGIIQNTNKYSWIKATYYFDSGELPEGVILKRNGELYGVPKETGDFEFVVRTVFQRTRTDIWDRDFPDQYATLTLKVKENTNSNVYTYETDAGYRLTTPIGVETSAGSYDFYLSNITDSLFVSEGAMDSFIDLWLNGEKLQAGVDYTAVSGSTRITINAQTLQNKALQSGNNTIAAEFRKGRDMNEPLRRTAQNFHLDNSTNYGGGSTHRGGGSGGSGGNGGNDGGSDNANAANGVTIAGCILDANGNHLAGVIVELHSTPRSTVTDENGFFQFANVEYGQHELFVKDQAGNVMASQKFEIQEGGTVALNGFVLTVPKGGTIPLAVKVANGTLTFSTTGNAADAAAQAAAAYAASASTGDDEHPMGWLFALLVSGCLAAGVVVYYRRKARIS